MPCMLCSIKRWRWQISGKKTLAFDESPCDPGTMTKIVRRTITVTIIERWTLLWLDQARLSPNAAVADQLPLPSSSGLLCTATSVTSTASVTQLAPAGDKLST